MFEKCDVLLDIHQHKTQTNVSKRYSAVKQFALLLPSFISANMTGCLALLHVV